MQNGQQSLIFKSTKRTKNVTQGQMPDMESRQTQQKT